MTHTQTHTKLYLCSLDKRQHARTCGYWYTVTTMGGTPHTAFRRKASLLRWLAERGLSVEQDIPNEGTPSGQPIVGEYRTAMHLEAPSVLDGLRGERTSRTLSNGDYVVAVITHDADDLRTVHTLNPNVRDRHVYDYQESEREYA